MTGTPCPFFWGSHGCGLEIGHGSVHECNPGDPGDPDEPCCQYDEQAPPDRRVRFAVGEPAGWGEWGPYGEGWYQ